MPRESKGPRLWFRKEEKDPAGKLKRNGAWIIIDGSRHIATGCAREEAGQAHQQLAQYIADSYAAPRRRRDIEDIPISDVLSVYIDDRREEQANKRTFDGRMKRLNDWWGGKMLAEINGETCRAYGKRPGATQGGTRRDLEDLRAAINHHSKEGLHRGVVRVALPPKGLPRDRWLTRSEVARMVKACWRFQEHQLRHRGKHKGETLPTKKYPLRHTARFILIGVYTGTRASAIAAASSKKEDGRSWVDLENGLFYRLAGGARATNKRQPPVPLPSHLLAHMRRWERMEQDREAKTGSRREYFVEKNGKPIASGIRGVQRAIEIAGVPGPVTPHTFRHTAATWLMQNGAPMWEAAGFLGMSEKVLRETYGHHHPDYMRGAAELIRKPTANRLPKKQPDKTRT